MAGLIPDVQFELFAELGDGNFVDFHGEFLDRDVLKLCCGCHAENSFANEKRRRELP